MHVKYTIVIPVYNVADYLEDCLVSISEAATRFYSGRGAVPLQVVCVDDGSTDRSAIILDDYRQRCSFLEVIHKENSGVGSARNAGLEVAKGDWIGFIDPDDEVTVDYFEVLDNAIGRYSPDIIRFGYKDVCRLGGRGDSGGGSSYCINVDASPKKVYGAMSSAFVWNTFYNRETIKGIRFKNITPGEDVLFNWEVLLKTDRVAVLSAPIYHYLQRDRSLMHKRYLSLTQIESCGISMMGRLQHIQNWPYFDQVRNVIYKIVVNTYVGQLGMRLRNCKSGEQHLAWQNYCKYAREIFSSEVLYVPLPLRLLVKIAFWSRSYYLYRIMLLWPWECVVRCKRLRRNTSAKVL